MLISAWNTGYRKLYQFAYRIATGRQESIVGLAASSEMCQGLLFEGSRTGAVASREPQSTFKCRSAMSVVSRVGGVLTLENMHRTRVIIQELEPCRHDTQKQPTGF